MLTAEYPDIKVTETLHGILLLLSLLAGYFTLHPLDHLADELGASWAELSLHRCARLGVGAVSTTRALAIEHQFNPFGLGCLAGCDQRSQRLDLGLIPDDLACGLGNRLPGNSTLTALPCIA